MYLWLWESGRACPNIFFLLFSFSQPWNVCNKSWDAIILMQVTCSKTSYWIKRPENEMVGRETGWRLDSKNIWGICFKFLSVLFLQLFNDNMNHLIWLVGQLFYVLVKSLTRAFRTFFWKTKAQHSTGGPTWSSAATLLVFGSSPETLVQLQYWSSRATACIKASEVWKRLCLSDERLHHSPHGGESHQLTHVPPTN